MRYNVTIFVNTDRDCFFGYQPQHALAEVGTWTLTEESPLVAATTMWVVGNKEEDEIGWTGARYPRDVRSLSVGDLLKIVDEDGKQTFLVVESVGWRELLEPTNPIVPLEGTWATSRGRTNG